MVGVSWRVDTSFVLPSLGVKSQRPDKQNMKYQFFRLIRDNRYNIIVTKKYQSRVAQLSDLEYTGSQQACPNMAGSIPACTTCDNFFSLKKKYVALLKILG